MAGNRLLHLKVERYGPYAMLIFPLTAVAFNPLPGDSSCPPPKAGAERGAQARDVHGRSGRS